MNKQIKQVIKEMILNGEIKIEIETQGGGLNRSFSDISLSVDGEKQPEEYSERMEYEY